MDSIGKVSNLATLQAADITGLTKPCSICQGASDCFHNTAYATFTGLRIAMLAQIILFRRPPHLMLWRPYSNFSVWLISEFFNPLQPHMVAVTEGLRLCHDLGHFSSYVTTIVVSTVILRSALVAPLYTFSEKNQALIATAYCQSILETANSHYSIRQKDGEVNARLQQSLLKRMFAEKCRNLHCHPLKSAAFAMVQLPVWMTATFGLRNACGMQITPFVYWPPTIPEFVTEGLVSPTSSLCLVITTALVTAFNVELGHLRRVYRLNMTKTMTSNSTSIHADIGVSTPPLRLPWQLKFARGVGLLGSSLITIVSLFAPYALVVFWCTSASHQLVLHLLHLNNRVRIWLGIRTPLDAKHPYLALWSIAKRQYPFIRRLNN